MNHTVSGGFVALLCAGMVLGCGEQFEVRGQVLSARGPVPNASVTLGGRTEVLTDEAGRFRLEGVRSGRHLLTVHHGEGSALVTEQRELSVSGDTSMEALMLPVPVDLRVEQGTLTATTSSVVLRWTPAFAHGFREYKIYRHDGSGLDESTGTLIHVSTDLEATHFESVEAPRQTFYYRVFVMNELGRLGGSNVASLTTAAHTPPPALVAGQPVQGRVFADAPHQFYLETPEHAALRVQHEGDIELRVLDGAQEQVYAHELRTIMMSGHPLLVLARRAERLHFRVATLPGAFEPSSTYSLTVSEQSLAAQAVLTPAAPQSLQLPPGAIQVLHLEVVAGTRYRLVAESSAAGAPASSEVLTFASVFGADVAAPYVWDQPVGLRGAPASWEFTAARSERLTLALVAAYWWEPTTVTASLHVVP